MTLEKAIIHAEEIALQKDTEAEEHNPRYTGLIRECKECADEHRQLAEWLRKLQKIKEIYDNWNVDFGVDDHRAMNKIGEVLNGNDD